MTSTELPNPRPLCEFIAALTRLAERRLPEPAMLAEARPLLAGLVSHDDWLPPELAEPDPVRYRQFLLYADPLGRFSIVSFVWGPGQATPVHDHTVWGLIGMLRGDEESQGYVLDDAGTARPSGEPVRLSPGQVEAVSPTLGDVHRVRNLHADRTSVSIHVYGANIGAVRRSVYPAEGGRKPFVSGYSNGWLPNLWDVSKEH
ncbi:cysteine dioxygenase [Ideonella azotifigens]|uniref:3-mercaptopropionate dioxygenase n=1 Tax=Ideonella azotifigens TaxID=513160 RepID=A0ABN1KLN1_9BURK|nr:cysteine dioxygenase [Ideonella azotifigens]MCD2343353.1 cysteine dioxygenase [Ideonella azotifigens]